MTRTGVSRESSTQKAIGLGFQRCRWCATASFRRQLCPMCASSDFTFEHGPGEGVVVSSTVVHRYTELARNESLVRFPEGFALRCRVVGARPDEVWAGARVRPVDGLPPDTGQVVVEIHDAGGQIIWR